jgi:DnaJ-class molecular chaperone
MTYQKMQHFPLESAYLCQDCNSVGNNAMNCPACASSVVMNLATVLDREVSSGIRADMRVTYAFPTGMPDVAAMVA